MSTITKTRLSLYRKAIGALVKKIDRLSSRCLHIDPLIHGAPMEVMRRCGKANCKCSGEMKDRHGPYKVISVVRNGKQRQIALKQSNQTLWQLAVHYQYQKKILFDLKQDCEELVKEVEQVIEKRTMEFP